MCVSCSVSFCMCMCVGLRVLWLPSVTCVGHVLSLPGWGRRSRETAAEHKGETQAGRQAGGRQAACQGAWAPTPGLLRLRGVVFRPGLDMLPRGPCVRPCAHTHPCKRGALPYPESYHFSPPGHSHAPPQVVLLKTNLHPSSVAPIHKTSSHSGKRFPTLSHLRPPLPQPDHQTHKRNIPFRALP